METHELLEARKAEIDREAQVIKDRLIDYILADFQRRIGEFTNDWNVLMGKKSNIEKQILDSDKLNVK